VPTQWPTFFWGDGEWGQAGSVGFAPRSPMPLRCISLWRDLTSSTIFDSLPRSYTGGRIRITQARPGWAIGKTLSPDSSWFRFASLPFVVVSGTRLRGRPDDVIARCAGTGYGPTGSMFE
jgi:hypothetical protein